MNLPVRSDGEGATIAFGIRNVAVPETACAELIVP